MRTPDHRSPRRHVRRLLICGLAAAVAPLLLSSTAQAGCGCDHPPPEWAPVMPIFAPVGARIRIHPDGRAFVVGDYYHVEVDGRSAGDVVAEHDGYLEANVPEGVDIGPATIEVFAWKRGWFGWYLDRVLQYGSADFTVLSDFIPLPDRDGLYSTGSFDIAVDSDGTVLVPVDLSMVHDAHQFAFQMNELALGFSPETVVIYNKDGVDLTLFTLAVDDSTKREWGSYYGWRVEEDEGLMGMRFNNRTGLAWNNGRDSDVLTYWRHEFRTYAFAHMPGMTHEVGPDGFHASGSLHIDHDFIVLAIKGMERNRYFPSNPYFDEPVRPGSRRVNLRALMQRSRGPVEPGPMVDAIEKGRPTDLAEVMATYEDMPMRLADMDEWLAELDEDERAAALENLEMALEEAERVARDAEFSE